MASTYTDDDEVRGGLGSALRIRIELWLVVVFMALSFGAGILVTALYEAPADDAVVGLQDPAGGVIAPPLTDDQIAGGLPSGHPDLSGGATGATGAQGGQDDPAQGQDGTDNGNDDGK